MRELLTRQENLKYRLILEGIAVGLLAGLVSSAFRWTLMEAEDIRNLFLEGARQSVALAVLGIFLLGVLAAFVGFLLKREPLISGSGIPQVEGEMHGKINANWLQVLIAKFLGAVCAIGGGLSLGREGPSIQLGAMGGQGIFACQQPLPDRGKAADDLRRGRRACGCLQRAAGGRCVFAGGAT